MTRCLIPSAQWDQSDIALPSEHARHLIKVLRMKRGDRVSVLDGEGKMAEACLTSTTENSVKLKILLNTIRTQSRPKPEMTIIQAMPKHRLMEGIIQKAVELGFASLHPIVTERVIAGTSKKKSPHRITRWRKIAMEAARQSGAAWITEIHPVTSFKDITSLLKNAEPSITASLQTDATPLRDIIKRIDSSRATQITVIIGPEGDFTDNEYAALRSVGATPASLGSLVLRVETAAIFMMSALSCAFAPYKQEFRE